MSLALQAPKGFTLTEMMIALAIAGILALLAVPSFLETVRNSRLTAQTDEFLAALNLARSEALKRGVRVSLCKSADGSACATAGGWEQGWISFVDANPPLGSRDTANPNQEPILRSQQALPNLYNSRASAVFADAIGFLANGAASGSGVFVNCYNGVLTGARAIAVNSAGTIRQLADGNGDKIPNVNATTNVSSCTAP